MDFYALCKWITQNSSRITNKPFIYKHLVNTYTNLQIKKNKLKLGSITFEMKPYTFNNVILFYSFEMVFSLQPSFNTKQKTMNNILNFFNWTWDFKNIFTLILLVGSFFYYTTIQLRFFYTSYIHTTLVDEDHLNIILNQIFTLIEFKPLNSSFVYNFSNIIADLAIYLNLF